MTQDIEQRSEEWFRLRAGKVTASRMGDVCAKDTTARYQNYMAELIAERLTGTATEGFCSEAMQHGTDTEPEARTAYAFYQDVDVSEVGFVEHPSIKNAGASPDGLSGDDGLVEIKCPKTAKHISTSLGAAIDKDYVRQMQWQMACTGRQWCDFVSYDPRLPEHLKLHVRRVPRDDDMIAELEAAASAFLDEIERKIAALGGYQVAAE